MAETSPPDHVDDPVAAHLAHHISKQKAGPPVPTIPLTGDPIVINIIVQLLSAGSSNALALGGVGSSGLGSTGLGSFDSASLGSAA
ncbi:hypothetical protein BS297_13725 [Rhodococcus erythropolis]|uniref:Uncharacterized protein n=1 Tax=Rhodococcus erythropolis TaxID=1833 RepID=A0A0C2WCF9_RHOER|nr:hypothetical protein BS297_13725 [Rhodococcus erythropolis]KIM15787.1 hypothetical protein QV65_20040 [Rhodococcus erythropolis]